MLALSWIVAVAEVKLKYWIIKLVPPSCKNWAAGICSLIKLFPTGAEPNIGSPFNGGTAVEFDIPVWYKLYCGAALPKKLSIAALNLSVRVTPVPACALATVWIEASVNPNLAWKSVLENKSFTGVADCVKSCCKT